MAVPFDHIASTYDSVFSRTALGQLQRKHVWAYLEKVIPELNGLEMLELNYGAGEDAILFSDKGFNIVATDVASEMQKVTEQKKETYSLNNNVCSRYLDLDSFNDNLFEKKFDLIFSNFGSLNCISPEALQKLFERIPKLLNPEGRFIGVVMPKFCLWESVYHFAKFRFSRMFCRWTSEEVISNMHGTYLRTWYYTPTQIKQWASKYFEVQSVKPIGIALPPAYLDTLFLRKKKLLISLHRLEKKINRFSACAAWSDHFIIDLQLK